MTTSDNDPISLTGTQTKSTDFVILNDNPSETLIPALENLLPTSLPLLRRIQYDHASPRENTYYVASSNLLKRQNAVTSNEQQQQQQLHPPWIAAYIDLFAGRETQVWVYSSLEAEVPPDDDNNDDYNYDDDERVSNFSSITPDRQNIAREQFWGLLQFINRELMPAYQSHLLDTADQKSSQVDGSGQKHSIPSHAAPAILLGSLHTGLMKLLTANDLYTNAVFRTGLKVHRYDRLPYVKYILEPEIFQTDDDEAGNTLPSGYVYGNDGLLPEHAELVISRTHIPREPQTLLSMPSVVIYHNNSMTSSPSSSPPVAWGFLSYDGSLVTLHVESEHRGIGLATILSKEVMRRGIRAGFQGSGSGSASTSAYGHADVAKDNVASRKVMQKVGGGKGWSWTVTWTVVELV